MRTMLRSSMILVFLGVFSLVAPASGDDAPVKAKKLKKDPYKNFNFKISFGEKTVGACNKISGLSANVEGPVKKGKGKKLVLKDCSFKKKSLLGKIVREKKEPVTFDLGVSSVKSWNLFGCWPKQWKINGLDGKGNDILTEEMVIVIEWFEVN